MLRIGYIFNHHRIVGGGELSFIDLIDAIREFGVNPVAFVPGPGEVLTKLETIGVDVCETPWPPIGLRTLFELPGRQSRLAKHFRELGLDLVHTNGARCMLYSGPAARRAGVPCVWHVRVLERDRILDRIRSHYATAIVANSRAVADRLTAYTNGGSRNTYVIYNGLKLGELRSAQPVDLQREFGIPPGPVILAAGRFTRRKGFEDLIRACGLLREKETKFSLLLLGEALPQDKAYEQTLKDLAAEMNLENVFFPGWRNDISSIMKSASAFVLPSHVESFGRVIIEAWACGVPVIASDAGGPAELIRHEIEGLQFPVGDIESLGSALSSVLEDSSLADRLKEAGFQKGTEFSLEKHAEQVQALYEDLCREPSREGG